MTGRSSKCRLRRHQERHSPRPRSIGEKVNQALKRYPEVAYSVITIGTGTSSINQGAVYVKLTPKDSRQRTDMELRKLLRKDFARWPSLKTIRRGGRADG